MSDNNLIASIPPKDECSKAFNGCNCACHRNPDVRHIVPCCYPTQDKTVSSASAPIPEVAEAIVVPSFNFLNIAPGSMRTGSSIPSQYRLAKYPDGSLVLQGCFTWCDGMSGGFDWNDIPIHIVDASEKKST